MPHLNWPGAAQVCRIERIRERAGHASREVAYAVTSLPPDKAGAAALPAFWRDRWLIEHRLHWRRDVVLREDQSRIRSGPIPHGMAALRNAVLNLTRNTPGPLAQTRETLRRNRTAALAAAQKGCL